PEQGVIPCHRVIFADGALSYGFAFGGIEVQKAMLLSEGVEVSADNKVDLKKYRWEG
ncbi:MAG: MGMT family protein, partial [Clostridia bacterium]|nr:MGMT family protein [Clostridia bacterium]